MTHVDYSKKALCGSCHGDTNVTREEAMKMLARATMRPFDGDDWYAFAGCETKDPMIGEVDDYLIVLDGACLCVIRSGDIGPGMLFELGPNLC